MAWTTPKTWAVGEMATAANFNTHIKENLDYLKAQVDALAAADKATGHVGEVAISGNTNTVEATLSGTLSVVGSSWVGKQIYIVAAGAYYTATDVGQGIARLKSNGVEVDIHRVRVAGTASSDYWVFSLFATVSILTSTTTTFTVTIQNPAATSRGLDTTLRRGFMTVWENGPTF